MRRHPRGSCLVAALDLPKSATLPFGGHCCLLSSLPTGLRLFISCFVFHSGCSLVSLEDHGNTVQVLGTNQESQGAQTEADRQEVRQGGLIRATEVAALTLSGKWKHGVFRDVGR